MAIPVYNAELTDYMDGIMSIALVKYPATETPWMVFEKDAKPEYQKYSIVSTEKHLIRSVIMLADTPIYRFDANMGEYYVVYSKETLREMAKKLFATYSQNNFNIEHTEGWVEGVNMVQCFIKDIEGGINPTGFEAVADGSLFGEYYISNENIWENIKNGVYEGLSLEGYFTLREANTETEQKNNKTEKKVNRMSKLKEKLKKLLEEFTAVNTDKGELNINGEIAVGAEVTDAEDNPAADGEYVLEDGRTIVVGEGKITEVREKEEEPAEEEPAEEPQENEEEQPAEEEPAEEEPVEEQPAEERDLAAEIDALKDELKELRSLIDAIREQLAVPAQEPIVEQFEAATGEVKKLKGYEKAMAMAKLAKK